MPSTTSLINKLRKDFPEVSFIQGDTFRWMPKEKAVYYTSTPDTGSLLHEVAHAALGHNNYTLDIELIKMEREAWNYATTALAPKYNVEIDQTQVSSMIDTYRDWLHDRSLCPRCEATGVQIGEKQYNCLACTNSWRVNEARSCALRRYSAS